MPGPKYSPEEDAIIMMYYSEEGSDVVKRLPTKRSRKSVQGRVAYLKAKFNGKKRQFNQKWYPCHETSMKMMYGQLGEEGMFDFFKERFTLEAIRHKARRMELVKDDAKPKKQEPEPEPIDPNEEDMAPMIHRHIPEGEWKRDHPIPRRSVFDVEARA